jgi:hypothetical protein
MIGAGVNERTLWADSKKRIEVSVYGDGDIENVTLSWATETGEVAPASERSDAAHGYHRRGAPGISIGRQGPTGCLCPLTVVE